MQYSSSSILVVDRIGGVVSFMLKNNRYPPKFQNSAVINLRNFSLEGHLGA
jgi:hypothetical protein